MPRLVPGTPVQGALYHRLTTIIAANHAGLGPNNVETASYRPMTGLAFQKPLSGSTSSATPLISSPYR